MEDIAYFGGHYLLTEPPLLTWLASPLYAVGALVATAWPGAGWAPAFVSLLALLLLLATAVGAGRLAEQAGLTPSAAGDVVILTVVAMGFIWAVWDGSAWLAAAALFVWLLVGMRWDGRALALTHGLLAGLLIGAHPWFAPAALAALAATRRGLVWRGIGLAPPLLLVGAWQWLLFGRPWRFASQFALEPGSPWLPEPIVILAMLAIIVIAAMRRDRWTVTIAVVCLLAVVASALSVEGPWRQRPVALAGVFAAAFTGIASLTAARPSGGRWLSWGLVLVAVMLGVLLSSGERWLTASVLFYFGWEQRAALALLVALAGGGMLMGTRLRSGGLTVAGAAVVIGWLATASPAAVAAPNASLVPPFAAPAPAGGEDLTLWRVAGGARLDGGQVILPDTNAVADSPIVAVRPGERYCAAAGPTVGTVELRWEDDAKRTVEAHGGQGPTERLCFAAPPGVTGVRLRLTGGAAPLRGRARRAVG